MRHTAVGRFSVLMKAFRVAESDPFTTEGLDGAAECLIELGEVEEAIKVSACTWVERSSMAIRCSTKALS